MSAINVAVEWQNFDGLQQSLDACCEQRRVLLAGTESQFARHDHARAHIRFTDLGNTFLDATAWIPDEISEDVSVEQVAVGSCSSSTTGETVSL